MRSVRASISITSSTNSRTRPGLPRCEAAQSTRQTSRARRVSPQIRWVGTFRLKVRRIEEFRLKAPVIDVRKQQTELGFNLGNREGLRIDQGMYIVEYDQNNKRRKIGYSRVRGGQQHQGPEGEQLGAAAYGRGAWASSWSRIRAAVLALALGGGTVSHLAIAANLGYALNAKGLSETWFYFAGYANAMVPVAGGLGIKKLFYSGRFAPGFKLGAAGDDTGENVAVDAQGVLEIMFGGWGALPARNGLTPVGPGGSAGGSFTSSPD